MKYAIALLLSCAAPVAAQDIFVLGEVHDNPAHHLEQARRIEAIQPAAIVFEMLSSEQAAQVNADRSNPDLGALVGWETSGWPDFAIYAPIFAASDAPVYGAAVSMDVLRGAMDSTAAAAFGEDADIYGLTDITPEQQSEMVTEQQEAHCDMLPENMLPMMVEAQRFRDAAFARTTLQALDDTGGPVVVITGNGHARTDRGVPAVLSHARSAVSVFALGQFEEGDDTTGAPYDEITVAPTIEREDPCAAFR